MPNMTVQNARFYAKRTKKTCIFMLASDASSTSLDSATQYLLYSRLVSNAPQTFSANPNLEIMGKKIRIGLFVWQLNFFKDFVIKFYFR
jgi:hypothetical protein